MGSRTKKVGLGPLDYLDAAQVERLTAYVAARADEARRRHLRRGVVGEMLIGVLLNTGLRASEVCALELRDLPCCHGKPAVWVRRGKGGKSQVVLVHPTFADSLNVYVRRYRPRAPRTGPLFLNERGGRMRYRSVWAIVKGIGRAAGMPWLAPHKLRHTYAAHLRNAPPYDMEVVQQQMRHADPATTKIYAPLLEERVRAQIAALPWLKNEAGKNGNYHTL